MAARKKLYSYIKKPFSAEGWISFFISVLSFIMAQAAVLVSVIRNGDVGLATASLGVISVLFAASAIIFALSGIKDRDKNRSFALAALAISLFVIAEWAVIVNIR